MQADVVCSRRFHSTDMHLPIKGSAAFGRRGGPPSHQPNAESEQAASPAHAAGPAAIAAA